MTSPPGPLPEPKDRRPVTAAPGRPDDADTNAMLALAAGTVAGMRPPGSAERRRDEVSRHLEAVADGEDGIVRATLVSVTPEEREALERGEMPESVLLRALQQQVEDGIIEGLEERL